MKAVTVVFGIVGVLLPAIVLIIDRLSPHGWWPRWVFYVWPTSYMLLANEALVNTRTGTVTLVSVVLNSLIYALVGFVLYAIIGAKGGRKEN
jgi:ABC-type glycerol-3-phosphate transport system permease component